MARTRQREWPRCVAQVACDGNMISRHGKTTCSPCDAAIARRNRTPKLRGATLHPEGVQDLKETCDE